MAMSRTSVLFSALRALLLSNASLSDSLLLERFLCLSMLERRFLLLFVSVGNEREKLDCAVLENDS